MDFRKLVKKTISSPTSDYEVQALLGGGSFGVVLQCFKKLTNETVALKMIKEEYSNEFAKDEVEILKILKDAGSVDFNIVTCNNVFMFGETYCLEFEKLDISLDEYLEYNTLSLKEIRPILHQLVMAHFFLESCDVVHTDMKPDNIMMVDHLRQPLKIKVIDFGLAITRPQEWLGEIRGTYWYIAPEMLLGAPFNHRIDTWSLGCIAAEMLRGKPLFPGRDQGEMMIHILKATGIPPSYVMSVGCYTDTYFNLKRTRRRPHIWTLKSTGEMRRRFLKRMDNLNDLLEMGSETSEDDIEAMEFDRMAFVDLVTKMLHVDPAQRITPQEMWEHPFLTLTHLDPYQHHSYVKLSSELMEVSDTWNLEGEDASSCSSDYTTDDHVTYDAGECSTEEKTPIKKTSRRASYNFRQRSQSHFEHPDSVSSSGDSEYTPPLKRKRKLKNISSKANSISTWQRQDRKRKRDEDIPALVPFQMKRGWQF